MTSKSFSVGGNQPGKVQVVGPDASLLTSDGRDASGSRIIHKFGHNPSVGTSWVPISQLGVYRTPQVSGATTLRIKAGGNANDTAGGSGAQSVILRGLDANGIEIHEELATNGTLASASTSKSFLRLFRVYVSSSGTYASFATPNSHVGNITIENTAGTQDWAMIENVDIAHGQSEIGAYTIPAGYRGFIHSIDIQSESAKEVDAILFTREGILQTAAPYEAMRTLREFHGITGVFSKRFEFPLGPIPALSDVGFLSQITTGVGEVSVQFELCLVRNA